MDLNTSTLGEIACSLPGATNVFRKYKLDFCCSGNRDIKTALVGTDVDQAALLADLGQLSSAHDLSNPVDFNNDDLIKHILYNYHEKHRRDLPELARLAQKVEQVHAGKEYCPVGLTQHLVLIMNELEQHMQKEEQVLFPAIQQHMTAIISAPINVMQEEHLEHGQHLEKLTALVYDFYIPEQACNTWRALILGVKTFAEEITEHIHLENNVLFPRALSESQQPA